MKMNARQRGDGLALLRGLEPGAARLVVFDPQYREIMERQRYGNEGARQRDRALLPQMDGTAIERFLAQIDAKLAPSGHLLWWVDKYTLAEGLHLSYLRAAAPRLQRVDLIHWNTGRQGMGSRSRSVSQYLIVAQKEPTRADAWRDRSIPDSWVEKAPTWLHPHVKPIELTRRLVLALTRAKDMVVDPCAGGFGVLDICQKEGRAFAGCDLAWGRGRR